MVIRDHGLITAQLEYCDHLYVKSGLRTVNIVRNWFVWGYPTFSELVCVVF